MQHNYSLENHILKGSVQFVEEIKTDLDKIQVVFQDINTYKKNVLEVVGFNNFSIVLDSSENMVKKLNDFTQQTLIGLSYEKKNNIYIYCLKTDDYEVVFESVNFPSITPMPI